jgi:hypothetical protein
MSGLVMFLPCTRADLFFMELNLLDVWGSLCFVYIGVLYMQIQFT